MDNLLPGSINTVDTRVLEQIVEERLAAIPLEKLLIYIIEVCDVQALPYLARQFNVLGNRGWRWADTEQKQRDLLKRAIKMQRKEGTEFSVKESLKVIGIDNAQILHPIPGNFYDGTHTFNGTITYGGAYHWACFKVLVDTEELATLPSDTVEIAVELINEWKNVRSRLIAVEAAALIEDLLEPTDELLFDMEFTFVEQVGPITYDGTANYDGSATHNGTYDELQFNIEGTLAKAFTLFTNAEPENSTIDLNTAVNADTLWQITWPDGSQIGYYNSGSFGVSGYVVPPQSENDMIDVKVDDTDKVTEISLTSAVCAGLELSVSMPNLVLIAATNSALELFSTNGESFPALVDIQLSGNKLSTDTVNAILAAIEANGVPDGTLDLSGQTPPAPPSGAGLTAKAALEANGWTVTTD